MNDALSTILRARVLPVVALDDPAQGESLAGALSAGGLTVAEITLRTPAALAAIEAAARVPGFTVAAGTVLTSAQVDQCVDAGAQVVVSPGFDPEVVERARQRGITAVPGVATATEIQRALAAGCLVLKLFPASALGGPPLLRALAGPFAQVQFVPSGGIDSITAPQYAAEGNVLAVSGSWMAPAAAIAAGAWTDIEASARFAVAAIAR